MKTLHANSSQLLDPLKDLAKEAGIEYVKGLFEYPLIKEKTRLLPYSFAKKRNVIPFQEVDGCLYVAVADPYDLETLEEVRYITKSPIKEVLASKAEIASAIEECYRQREDEASQYILGLKDPSKPEVLLSSEGEYDLLDHETDSSVIKVLNMILVEALSDGASDIHFEPIEKGLIVRYRVDGILQHKHTLSKEVQVPLTTRLKVLAQLDIAEFRLPQDGRLKLRMAGREIDFRVSTVPVVFGERVVLRILDRSSVFLSLDQLEIRPPILKEIKKYIKSTQGIILVTGPTGSGKSTTLYAALAEIRSNLVNIMTIEDPVEIKLEGMAQIGVNPKIDLTFSKGLRHILRQDPDVIMIGEIRDRETAEIAVQASLTGHLVLSTLHTNDAPSAIARLVDMGVEPYLISSALVGVLAQRLVRRICSNCKTTYKPSKEELKDLQVAELGIDPGTIMLSKGKGCEKCYGTGYRGRCGLYELMPITKAIKNQMLISANATDLRQIAISEGMSTLSQEGALLAIKKGITTHEEVLRVVSQFDEEEGP